MHRDKRMLEAAIYTKPKSQIGLSGIRPINHFNIFEYISGRYREQIRYLMNEIDLKLTDGAIEAILKRFKPDIINDKIKEFIKLFLMKRIERMVKIYEAGV
jgi:hypothetical protein